MAIIDTGLGWSADENWLRQSAGKMGSVIGEEGEIPPGFYELPVTPATVAGITAGGLVVGWSDQQHKDPYLISATETGVYFCLQSTSSYKHFFVGSKSTSTAVVTVYTKAGGIGTNQCNVTWADYPGVWTISSSLMWSVRIPILDYYHGDYDFAASLARFGAGARATEFYKLHSNWAVSSIVRWYDWNGSLQISPVLISTDANAIDLSLDGTTTVSSALGTYLVDGLRFYMRVYLGNINTGTVTATGAHYIDLAASHGNTTLDALFYLLKNASSITVPHVTPVDPYSPGGPTTTGGGEGTHIAIQDNIVLPPIPSYSYSSTGFFSIWIPNDEQLKQLAAYMWNANPTTINFWKRLISDPIDIIIGLSVLPFYISPEGVESVSLGYVDSGINMSYTNQQFVDISCGSVTIPELWGAYLDYNPYTKVEVFLPYIGTRELNVDEIMGRTITITYRVDVVSGSCIALIEATKGNTSMLLYHFDGNCAVPVPITSFQMQGLVNKIIATGGAVGAAIASGGAAIPVAGAVSSALSLSTTKRYAQRSGNIGSAAGLLDVQIPYLVFTRPNQAVPENQNAYTGYPSFITETLSTLSGYTEVEVIHLHNIPCTEAELLEIDSLLKGGVIF